MELILIPWLIAGIVATFMAANKGREGFGWFLLCVAFGPLALILAVLLPARDTGR